MTETREHNMNAKCKSLTKAILLILVALTAYVFYIQVVSRNELAKSSEKQQSRLTYIPPKRGAILDRNGTILNSCLPQYDIAVRIDKIRDPRDTRRVTLNKTQAAISELAVFLGGDYYLNRPSRQDIERHIKQNAPLPFILWSNADADSIAKLHAHKHQFPFVEMTLTWCRFFYHPTTAVHVRGAVKQAAIKQKREALPDLTNKVVNFQDMTGADGIEKLCDEQLSGTGGLQKIQTDVFSFMHETAEILPAEPGHDVTLTLDLPLQKTAETLLQNTGHPGALVLLDATNGEILVMASTPSPNLPHLPEDMRAPNTPFLNRATRGLYPPGSTIKPFIALAALQQGIITPTDTLFCPGYFKLPDDSTIKCSSKNGHGYVNVSQALAVSCNTFFCATATKLQKKGFEQLQNDPNYNQFFGMKTQVFNGENEGAGTFYSPGWVENNRFEDIAWHQADSALAGIGQGAWTVTPLQLARFACAITTGRLFTPKILLDSIPANVQQLQFPQHVLNPVLEGLYQCVQTPNGTGRRLATPSMTFLAKTGTAEHRAGAQPHAWMFAVAPANNPRFVVACVLENGGHGGQDVAPLLKTFFQEVFKRFPLAPSEP